MITTEELRTAIRDSITADEERRLYEALAAIAWRLWYEQRDAMAEQLPSRKTPSEEIWEMPPDEETITAEDLRAIRQLRVQLLIAEAALEHFSQQEAPETSYSLTLCLEERNLLMLCLGMAFKVAVDEKERELAHMISDFMDEVQQQLDGKGTQRNAPC
jgi:hypothetical protein